MENEALNNKELNEQSADIVTTVKPQQKKAINSVVNVNIDYEDNIDVVSLLEYSDHDLHKDPDLDFKRFTSSVEATDEELVIIRKSLIGMLVRQLEMMMEKRGMTRASLARKLNVSKANITLMFSGEINMSINAILKFIRAINPGAALVLNIVED